MLSIFKNGCLILIVTLQYRHHCSSSLHGKVEAGLGKAVSHQVTQSVNDRREIRIQIRLIAKPKQTYPLTPRISWPTERYFSKESPHLGLGHLHNLLPGFHFKCQDAACAIVPRFPTHWGFSPPLPQPLLPPQTLLQPCCLPYPAEVRMIREVVVGGNVSIAGAQNPHK